MIKINHDQGISWIRVPALAMLLAFGGQMVACSADMSAAPASEEDDVRQQAYHRTYDGETIFRGIYFGTGPVAQLLPELWGDAQLEEGLSDAATISEDLAAGRFEDFLKSKGVSAERTQQLVAAVREGQTQQGGGMVNREKSVAAMLEALRTQDPNYFARFAQDMQSGDHIRINAALQGGAKQLTEIASDSLQGNPGAGKLVVAAAVVYVYAAVYKFGAAVSTKVVVFKGKLSGHGDSGLEPDRRLEQEVLVNVLATRLAS